MADRASSRASVISRSPSFLNRPIQAPMGPRTRVRSSHIPQSDASARPISPLSSGGLPKPRPFSTTPVSPSGTLAPAASSHLPEIGTSAPPLGAINEGDDSVQPSPVDLEPKPSLILPTPEAPSSDTLDRSKSDDAQSADFHGSGGGETQEHMEDTEEEGVIVKQVLVEEPAASSSTLEGPSPRLPTPEGPPPRPSTPEGQLARSPSPEEAVVDPLSDDQRREDDDPPAAQPSLPIPPSSHVRLPTQPRPAPKPLNPPKLASPYLIKFESVPVQWKGLPLEAAVWTFDSKELQAIVSRAIRSSARESYIRLLAIDILDNALPEEVERLEHHKTMTQAKYRFLVHRRTMQLQALLSSALAPPGPKDSEDNVSTATKLVVQISETTAECDQLMEELLKVTDQLGQIKRLLDHHWASALAIALRKLNGSYARRTAELSTARDRISQLEGELQDAWAEAEKLAREMDDLDAALSDEDEAIIETAEIVSIHPESRPMSPNVLTHTPSSPSSSSSPIHSHDLGISSVTQQPPPVQTQGLTITTAELPAISPLSPLLIKTAVPKRHSEGIEVPPDVPDSVSIKSSKSTKSYKSSSRDTNTRASVVSAAKKRSLRISQSSLRLPPGFGSGPGSAGAYRRSGSRPKTPFDTEDQPPVPELPPRFISPLNSSQSRDASSSLFQFDSILDNMTSPNARPMRSRRTSFDSVRVTAGHRSPLPWNGGVMDDMYIHPTRSDADGIETVPRTPPPVPAKMMVAENDHRPITAKSRKGAGIPSIWMNVDAPKTPAERVDSLMRTGTTKGKTYQRLRGLTKRYSFPFPLFSKANSSQQSHATS